MSQIIHLLPNAHLDPVWLWDWREGLNEGIVTVRTILDLMDEYPKLTFMRGEAAIYEHIEKNDPKTFERIGRMVESGRWDVVGGTYIQPDSNLASTETLCRHFERGLRYFESRFGKAPKIAWQADPFGHTPEWPAITRAFGMEGFAFTRPQRAQFPMESPAFWWKTGYGDSLLCYRQHWMWYCSERFNLIEMLDATLAGASTQPFTNVGLLMGLGNHGGGPTRRHIEDVEKWAAAHPETEVRFSTLHEFFRVLRKEITGKNAPAVPSIRGDIGYCLRGCYSSVAKFKNPYRKSEALVAGAESTQSVIAAALGKTTVPLDDAWDSVLFNSFHDILPGSSIERAFDDQIAWVGAATHDALAARFRALNLLAAEADTTIPPAPRPDRATDVPLIVWNPLPRAVKGWFEIEASLDYRPIKQYLPDVGSMPLSLAGPDGKNIPFQEIDTEHHSMRDVAWRKRLAVYDDLPAFGWKVYRFGYRENGKPVPARGGCTSGRSPSPFIAGADWRVAVTKNGDVSIRHRGVNLLDKSGAMQVRVVEDPWGSWGGMVEERDSFCLENVREKWRVARAEIIEKGPHRAALWTRWQGTNSWLELTFYVADNAPGVRVAGRLLMNERSARVKLVLPCKGRLRMEVPGGSIERPEGEGQIPSGRWVSRGTGGQRLGFVSDVLGDIDATPDELRVTLARASRYADDVVTKPDETPWLPAVDAGELKFNFWLTGGNTDLDLLADDLLHPPIALLAPPHPGPLGKTGSLGAIEPTAVKLLAAQKLPSGKLSLRLQNCSGKEINARWIQGKTQTPIARLRPWEIVTASIRLPARKNR